MSGQYPPQQPYNNQPTSNQPQYPYNQSQYPYNQSPPYPHQQQPGQFVQPPAPKVPLSQRFKALPKKTKAGLGCGTLLLILSLCICSAVASSVGSPSKTASLAPTATSTQVPTTTPKPTATPQPIPKPTVKPTARPPLIPTHAPAPVPTQVPVAIAPTQPPAPPAGVYGNPWGYDFNAGNLIYNPPATICDYFHCITSFWKSTNGYVDECNDGTYSHSGGVSGACSRHGGEMRPLYSH